MNIHYMYIVSLTAQAVLKLKFPNTAEALKTSIERVQYEKVVFEIGDQARFKKLSPGEMKKLQGDVDIEWVPLLEDVSLTMIQEINQRMV